MEEDSRLSERERYDEESAGGPEDSLHGLRYTTFALRVVWVAVVVPFVAGAALALVLNLPERQSTPATLPERTERTSLTTPPERTTPGTTLEITDSTTATATSTVSP